MEIWNAVTFKDVRFIMFDIFLKSWYNFGKEVIFKVIDVYGDMEYIFIDV